MTTKPTIRMPQGGLLYATYGANTSERSMALRCPNAEPVGRQVIEGHKLVFRGVADVVPAEGRRVHVALWRITAECEASLDRFEGFPRLYVKKYGRLRLDGRDEVVMLYVMRESRLQGLPPESYEATLREGYADFGLPAGQIDDAIRRARAALKTRRQRDWIFAN